MFRKGAALLAQPPQVTEIPFEGTTLPGYFFSYGSGPPRGTVILLGGYDGTAEELYFLNGFAALERGYNVLAFDGPGQGSALIQKGILLRPDYETVVEAVIDYVLSSHGVDAKPFVLIGLSLGGYLGPRAATKEHRLAACVADCGSFDLFAAALERMPGPLASGVRDGKRLALTLAGGYSVRLRESLRLDGRFVGVNLSMASTLHWSTSSRCAIIRLAVEPRRSRAPHWFQARRVTTSVLLQNNWSIHFRAPSSTSDLRLLRARG